jgi:hypothetical protein
MRQITGKIPALSPSVELSKSNAWIMRYPDSKEVIRGSAGWAIAGENSPSHY